jgi:L-alanine-DL-glutamate epimerase-like enolase superfamily enzyme
MLKTTPRVTHIERWTLDVPFRERVAPWNALLISQHRVVEVVRVRTDDPDVVGWGETLPHYTWGRVSEAAVLRATGRPLAELTGDDALGCGLQMAVYDALGKALGVPVWRLLNRPRVRDECSLAWWSTKMPPEALAEEAKEALAGGYVAHKIKARPWFDVYAQIEAVSAVTPPHYHIEPDFNDMLLDAGTAAPVLRRSTVTSGSRCTRGRCPSATSPDTGNCARKRTGRS